MSGTKLTQYAPKEPVNLTAFIDALNNFAPLHLAGSWDNVGLLIEPSKPSDPIRRVFLTNDLTESVMTEAIEKRADLIISYHPPIFAPMKRITQSNWKERIVAKCLENQIALYSPHTAWDAIANGNNNWLMELFQPIPDTIRAIQPYSVECPTIGTGRLFHVSAALTFADAIDLVKKHLRLEHVQIAIGCNSSMETPIKTVGLCAGSGASVLKNISADLFLTGEMSHHDILDAVHRNINVIVCNHSNTERGYLHAFERFFDPEGYRSVEFIISEVDADPLNVK